MEENRIEAGIREWRGHMKRLSDLFDESITQHPNIKKVQLSHFRDVVNRPLTNITRDEKIMLGVLKAEIRRMEKVLYPSLLVRMARRIGRAIKPDKVSNKTVISDPAELVIKPVAVTKRNVVPVRTMDKSQKVKDDLIPKNRVKHSRGIKQ